MVKHCKDNNDYNYLGRVLLFYHFAVFRAHLKRRGGVYVCARFRVIEVGLQSVVPSWLGAKRMLKVVLQSFVSTWLRPLRECNCLQCGSA